MVLVITCLTPSGLSGAHKLEAWSYMARHIPDKAGVDVSHTIRAERMLLLARCMDSACFCGKTGLLPLLFIVRGTW